ncbi:MAG: acyl-CoA dehydratase activase [Veillonellales bacterium]
MSKSVVAGIDAGSTALKVALYDGKRFSYQIRPAGWNPREEALALLKEAACGWQIDMCELKRVVGTGYGRNNLPFVTHTMTEITCHAKGAAYLCPGAKTVVDIGGQDAKAIRLDQFGHVQDFVMNDKCAAGTGRFLQVMTMALGIQLCALADMSLAGVTPCPINAMCTVFAESEVIGLLNQGKDRHEILAGIIKSITGRVAAMADRINPQVPVVLTGGMSRITTLINYLEQDLGLRVIVPEQAVFAGAIGAALLAWDKNEKSEA